MNTLNELNGTIMEEWQDPDSGYLNCIGVGDTYVKKQIARILNQNMFKAAYVSYLPHGDSIDVWTDRVKFEKKEERIGNTD